MLHTASLYAPFMGFNITFYTALFSISLLFQFCDSIDTITSTQFISDAKNETLLSPNGNFKLGFFSPGNSLNRYLGIWFNKIPQQNVVWVANRDTPLKHKDGVFKLTKNGEIAVFSGENDRKPLWSSNVSAATSVNPSAKLLSTGNLVLSMRNGSGRVETVMWQSFDYPTDTGLAEMKFGLDKRTGLSRILTSWKSEEDPATGEYWAVVDPHEPPQFFVYKNLTRIWRGGPWNGQTLSGVPTVASRLKSYEMDYTNESSLFSSTYINNNDEVLQFTILFCLICIKLNQF